MSGLTDPGPAQPTHRSVEICPECQRPVGHSDFGAPCTPVDCDYRKRQFDGSEGYDPDDAGWRRKT